MTTSARRFAVVGRLACWFFLAGGLSFGAETISFFQHQRMSATDGKLKLSVSWIASAVPDGTKTEQGAPNTVLMFEYFVLLENISKQPVTVPSRLKRGQPFTVPVGNDNLVVYEFGRPIPAQTYRELAFVESPYGYHPVRLEPGERAKLDEYSLKLPTLKGEPRRFVVAVDQELAARYGWWSGSLACDAVEFRPSPAKLPKK